MIKIFRRHCMLIRTIACCLALLPLSFGRLARGGSIYATYVANPIATLPIGVQDPAQFLWVAQNTTGTGAGLINDHGTGHNAWQITDEEEAFPSVGNPSYETTLRGANSTTARTSGFRFEAFARFVDDFDDAASMGLTVFLNQRAYYLMLDLDDNENLWASLLGGTSKQLTFDGRGSADFHRFALQSSGGTSVTALFDGQPIGPSWTGVNVPVSHPDIFQFGSSGQARANRGAMAFRDVTLELSPMAKRAGDFDGDNDADGRDLLLWQRTAGSREDLRADANSDRVVNGPDLTVWRGAFAKATPAAHQTPEPATTSLVTVLVAPALQIGERYRRSFRR
jgi:hypothetical protein